MINFTLGDAGGPHWLETASWASQIILVIAALATLHFAKKQIKESAQSRNLTLKIAQATLLLELDARWDSAETKAARTLIGNLTDQTRQLVSAKNLMVSDARKETLIQEEWVSQLRTLRINAEEDYLRLLGMLGFFETVGLMVKKNYIAETDVLDLLKGPLIDMDNAFRQHIQERSNEMGVPNGLFEHALRLCGTAKNAG